MERTESVVVQVSPEAENVKIREKEAFGWVLQSRQEVMGHPEEWQPETFVSAVVGGAVEGVSGKQNYQYDHYVKLHFARPLEIAELTELRKLEDDFKSLPYPPRQSTIMYWLKTIVKGLFMLWALAAGITFTLMTFGEVAAGRMGGAVGALVVGLGLLALAWWLYSSIRSQNRPAKVEEIRQQSETRAKEIIQEAQTLLQET